MLKTLRKTVLPHDAADVAPCAAAYRSPYVHSALLKCPGGIALVGEFWEPATLFKLGTRGGLKQVVAEATYSNGSRMLVPHHVLVELPDETLAHDRRTGGHLISEMSRTLAALHQRDFADHLPEGESASYRVQASPELPAGTVRVRLGPAIHVARPEEAPAWRVQLSRDGADWDAWPALTLHERQRLLIASGSAQHGSLVIPDWPFPPQVGLVMLNLPGEDSLDLSAEPLRSLEISRPPNSPWTVIRQPGAGPDAPCLFLQATRLQPAAPVLPPVAPPAPEPIATLPAVSPAPDARVEPTLDPVLPNEAPPTPHTLVADDQPTLVLSPRRPPAALPADDAPTMMAVAPVRTAGLLLHGLVLQRPSLFGGSGAQGLQWALDGNGRVVAVDAPGALHRFELTLSDELHLQTRSGTRRLQPGDSLPLQGGQAMTRLLPVPDTLAPRCIGWLSLPPVAEARLSLGRAVTVGRRTEVLLTLRPLAGRGHLVGLPDEGGDRMGLSREHAELRPEADGLRVRGLGQATLLHLDEQLLLLGSISASQGATLTPGQHLLLGHYLWQFTG